MVSPSKLLSSSVVTTTTLLLLSSLCVTTASSSSSSGVRAVTTTGSHHRHDKSFRTTMRSHEGSITTTTVTPVSSLSSLSPSSARQLRLRGGGGGGGDGTTVVRRNDDDRAAVATSSSSSAFRRTPWSSASTWMRRHRLPLGLIVLTILVLYAERDVWHPWMKVLTDRERIQQVTLNVLRRLHDDDDGTTTSWRPYVSYGLGLTVWEALGLTTIPVETAAGMFFTWKTALTVSVVAKCSGALLAFAVGRTVLHDAVQRRLTGASPVDDRNNESSSSSSTTPLLALLKYNTQSPLRTALLMKFSVFPEFVKNVGTAVLFPRIAWWHHLLATTVHGGLFTVVWTALGVQAATELHHHDHNDGTTTVVGTVTDALPWWVMRGVIPTGLAVGMGLPVVLMAWWARQLRQERQRQQQEEQQRQQKGPSETSSSSKGRWWR